MPASRLVVSCLDRSQRLYQLFGQRVPSLEHGARGECFEGMGASHVDLRFLPPARSAWPYVAAGFDLQHTDRQGHTSMFKNPHPAKCISVDGAAELLGVTPLTIRRMIKAGKLRASHIGRRVVIRLTDLDRLLNENVAA